MAKVKIETGKTMKSPKALATQLLSGPKGKKTPDPQLVKDLATKIKEKNNLEKGQDLTSDMALKVGKVTTKKFGTLHDPSPTNKYNWYTPPVPVSGGGGVIGSRPEPIPNIPLPQQPAEDKSIKSASPDIILIDQNDLPIDLILNLTLEKIGGQELISLVRHDTVSGQNIVYQPVKNLADISISYNPQNIINIPETAEIYFKNFAIKLENHTVQDTNESPPISVYLDQDTGNIIIEAVNLKADHEVEVQMISSGKIFDDTIYEEVI
jgi:hypothetical protein